MKYLGEAFISARRTQGQLHTLPPSPVRLYQKQGTDLWLGDLIIKPTLKEQLDSMAVAASFYDALSEQVAEIVDDAAQRAEANERTTVKARDL